jgi:hypothetical protein
VKDNKYGDLAGLLCNTENMYWKQDLLVSDMFCIKIKQNKIRYNKIK